MNITKSFSLLSITLLVCIAMQTYADDQKKIEAVVNKINHVTFVQGQFNQQKKLQGLAYPLKAQGHFIFWKKQGLYLATDKPFFNAMTITGNHIINWQADGTGSITQEQSGIIQREINKTLLAFFSADIALIQQRFNTEWVFDKENWQLTLVPRLEMIQKSMRNVVIHGDSYMRGLTVMAGNGDETIIEFTSQQESAAPSATECRWFYLPLQDNCSKF